MPDPALLALLDHVTWSPPAIVEPAPAFLQQPMAAAYAAHVAVREQVVADWVEAGVQLRRQLWVLAVSRAPALSVDVLSRLIEGYERSLKVQERTATRFIRDARRAEKGMDRATLKFAKPLQDRLIAAVERFYAEGTDFALFLRALRAEVDPESRGGPTFDDAAALEKYLLAPAE